MATPAEKRRKSSKGRRRAAPQAPLYRTRAGDMTIAREQFRVVIASESRQLDKVKIDELVEHVNWERSGAQRTGELNFRRPLRSREAQLLWEGDEVWLYVDVDGDGRDWRFLWRMVVATPQEQIREGMISVGLRSRLRAAAKTRSSWKIGKGRRAHQVTKFAARRYDAPLGRLAAGRTKLGKYVEKRKSVMDVTNWAYKKERAATGRRFDVTTVNGVIEVLELRYPKYALALGPAVMAATLTRSLDTVASVLVVTSTTKRGGKKKKVRVEIRDAKRIRRYGWIKKTVNEDGLASPAEARRWGKRHLREMTGPRKDVTFTHPGIPFLDRGDAITLRFGGVGLHQTVFVKSVRHTVSAGSYEMEVTVGFDDPYRDAAAERSKHKRQQAAKAKGRPRERGDTHRPRSKKAERRAAA